MPNPFRSTCTIQPAQSVQRRLRFDSHGCSRVDNVRDLAAWLLKDLPHWSRAAIDAAIATGQREDIHLPGSPGGLGLSHGWMTKDQTVQFRNDIYDQDAQLLEATAEEAAFFNQAAYHPLTGILRSEFHTLPLAGRGNAYRIFMIVLRTQGPQRERNCAHRGGADSRFRTGAEAFFHFEARGDGSLRSQDDPLREM